MFEQLKSWSRKRKQQQPPHPRPRTILRVEWLEDRWCPSGDTYQWNPPLDPPDYNASDPANWKKDGVQQDGNGTIPGQNGNSPDDTVILDGNQNNLNIVWDKPFIFSTLKMQNGYIGDQTIDKNVTLDLTGVNEANDYYSLYCHDNSLNVNFADNTGKLQIDSTATIDIFIITGNGTVFIDGGTTTVCTSVDANSVLTGTIQVIDATLDDAGQNQIQLVGNNSIIQIQCCATMEVTGGGGKTLISEKTAGDNDYIDVQNAGELKYMGLGGTDTFTAPVLVEQGGSFTADGGAGGSTLNINGAEVSTQNVSLYVQGALHL